MKKGRHLDVIFSPEAWLAVYYSSFSWVYAYLMVITSAFRRKSSPEDEETSEIHTPDETQWPHPLLLPVARDRDIIDWAESIR